MSDNKNENTTSSAYAKYLSLSQNIWWKRLLDVQAPYRYNLRKINPGFTLDIGCGIGRNLHHINGNGVGVDHNKESVEIAKRSGLCAFTPEEFEKSEFNLQERFDSILLCHVAEHMRINEVATLLAKYMPVLKYGGKLILITPQEVGFRSDKTHVEFMDFEKLKHIANENGAMLQKQYSFPFLRFVGKLFKYNEFVFNSNFLNPNW